MTKVIANEPLNNTTKRDVSLVQRIKSIDDDSAKLAEIILNPNKEYHEKLKFIKNEIEESVREVEFDYIVEGFFEDTCFALHRAVEKQQGFTKMKNNKSASKDNPPTMVDVKFSDGTHIKVPYGVIFLPAFGKNAKIEMRYNRKRNEMQITGVCQRKFTSLMDEIIDDTNTILRVDSIYKNKAIKYDGTDTPEFIDLSGIDKIKLFLTDQAKYATVPIEVRIEESEKCRKNGIDLKFGVLLEGNYGTGKTLYANKLASKAIKNGWTFIYCSKPENTLQALKVANKFTGNGTGVVLFVEDIDRVLNRRDSISNEISLIMDGSETKNNNLISVFSTNHIENIDPTFLRGKRIGSIVTLQHLDAITAEEMIKHHLGKSLKEDCKLASDKVEDYKIVPSFLSEIIDRVKTHALLKANKEVLEKDILFAIEQFKRQMDIATVKTDKKSDEEQLLELQNNVFSKNVIKNLNNSSLYKMLREQLINDDYDDDDINIVINKEL